MRRVLLFFLGAMVAAALIQASPALGMRLTSASIGYPTISGTPSPGEVLSCIAPAGQTILSYSWQTTGADPSELGSGSELLVAPSQAGDSITCSVTLAVGLESITTTSAPVDIPGPPVNLTPPSISQDGGGLTCNPGTWTGDPTSYSYSWQRGTPPSPIGDSSEVYSLTSSGLGQEFLCTVQAHNAYGSSLLAVPSGAYIPTSLSAVGGSSGSGSGGASASGSSSSASGPGSLAPRVSSLSISPRRIVELVTGHSRTTSGARLSYRLNRSAGVLIVIERMVRPGTWSKVMVIGIGYAGAGLHRMKLSGRVHGRLLALGSYRALIAAANADGWSAARKLRFTVAQRTVLPRSDQR